MSQELHSYVHEHFAAGTDREVIKKTLIDAGWPEAEVVAAINEHGQGNTPVSPTVGVGAKKTVVYNPVLMAVSNILIPGGAYLIMGVYWRFFVALLLVCVFVFVAPTVANIIILAVIIDTYLQAKKLNDTSVRHQKNKALVILGAVCIIAFMAIYVLTGIKPSMFARSEDACKVVYAFNLKAQTACLTEAVRTKQSTEYDQLQAQKVTDSSCEALMNDASLGMPEVQRQYNVFFSQTCYLKKAVETKDGRYCLAGHDSQCLHYLAAINNDPAPCELVGAAYKDSCLKNMHDPEYFLALYEGPNCNARISDASQAIKDKCVALFGSFISGLK